MKRILLVISTILISYIADCQGGWIKNNNSYGTIGNRWSIDSTFFYPTGSGAPTSLQAYNLRKAALYYDSTAGVQYNYNPKTGIWGPSGGGASNLQSVTTLGNSTTDHLILAKKDSIGYVFKYGWSTNPLNTSVATDNTATASLTTDGIRTSLSGTAGRNTNNYIDFPTIKVGVENFTATWKMVIKDSALSNGIAMMLIPNGSASAMAAHYIITDSIAYIVSTLLASTFTTADVTNRGLTSFKFFQNDTIKFTFQRRSRSCTYEMYDINTGAVSKLSLDNTIFAGVGNLRLYDYGGSWDLVDSFRIKYDEHYNPDVLGIGDSWLYGGNALTEFGSHWRLATMGFSAVRESGPAENSGQAILRFYDILQIHPKYCGWYIGINDLNPNGSGPNAALDSFCKRTIRFIVLCQGNGIVPFLSTLGPQVTDAAKYNDSIYHIAGRYGNLMVIPTYETMRDPVQVYMAAQWITNDPIHMNQDGHNQLSIVERKKFDSLFQKTFPLQLQNLSKLSKFKGYLLVDDENRIGIGMPGTDLNYILAVPAVVPPANPQPAMIYVTGNNHWFISNDFRVSNLSIASSPMFKIDVTGVLATAFTSKNVTTVGGNVVFDGAIPGSNDAIGMLNDVKFYPSFYPFKIMAKNITTSKNALWVNNISATVPFDDSIATFHVNDSIKMFVNRFGGGRFYWQTGYLRPMDYSALNGLDFPDKTQLDSLLAAVVAGSGGITSFTTANGFTRVGSGSALAITTTIADRDLMFSSANAIGGNDSARWVRSRIEIPNFSLVNSMLQVGEINLQTAAADNSFLGFGVEYATGFKRSHGGQHGALIYQLSGDLHFQVNAASGSAGSAWTGADAMVIKSSGRIGDAGITAPNSWHQFSAGTSAIATMSFSSGVDLSSPIAGAWYYDGTRLAFSPSTTIKRVILSNDVVPANGKILIGNGTDFTVASPTSTGTGAGITFTTGAGTLDINSTLSDGKAGGQTLRFGTGANDQGLIRGSIAASGSTTTNPDVTFITGDGVGITAFQLLKNTTALFYGSVGYAVRTVSGTTTAAVTDRTILVDATSGAITINLPAVSGATKIEYVIKKIDNSINAVTLDGNASETIDGATTKVINTQYSGFKIQCDGSAWYITGTF